MSVVIPGGATGVPHGIPVTWSVHPTHTHCVGSSVDLRQGAMGGIKGRSESRHRVFVGKPKLGNPPLTRCRTHSTGVGSLN